MKRPAIILSIIAALGMIAPSLHALAQPLHVPHENPAAATVSLDSAALLLSYSRIYNLATNRQYQDAREVLNELRNTDIPDELRYIVDRYSKLSQQLVTSLDNSDSHLDEATIMLAHNQIHEAEQRLGDAGVHIQDAGSLLKDIKTATDTLSDRLGIPDTPAASPARQAHARLQESTDQLKQPVDRLKKLQQSLTGKYEQMTGLLPTELSLSINPSSVFVGDSITVSGRLSGDGKPMAGKKLSLTMDNKPIANTSTGFDGSYLINITIPYKYVTAMTLTAAYKPSGDDTGKYLASESPPVTIDTGFYQTRLETSAPETGHPGLPFTIGGRVSSNNSHTYRTIRIVLDDTRLAEKTAAGQFSLELTPPEQVPTGKHSLIVSVLPYGRYSGASENRTITISRLPIYVDTQMPNPVLLPQTVRISGRVYHELGPIPNAKLSLNFKNSSVTATTSPDGSFNVPVRVPLDLSFVGAREITIDVPPPSPGYSSFQLKIQLFTINPFSTGLILVIFIAVALLINRRSQTRVYQEKGIPRAEVIELPAITPAPQPGSGLTSIKARILSAYRGGLEAVERITGIGMAPRITLREFLKMATLLLPAAIRQFAELTTITEVALYSDFSPHEDTAARAEQLATIIREELHRDTL